MSTMKWVESVVLQLPMRIALGGVFCFAAYTKLGDVQSFAEAIKGFKVLDVQTHEYLIISAAFTMPWIEMIAGVLLILGLWTRAATLTIGLMLVMFMIVLIRVIISDSIDADCSCFGDVNLVCESAVGWCQVIRDLIMLVPVGYLLWRGGGKLSLDEKFAKFAQIEPNEPTQSPTKPPQGGLQSGLQGVTLD